jgi:D-3-phosphoglycerate dehydrogenase
MVGQISTDLGREGLNILDMLNKSRDGIAVTLLDVDKQPSAGLLKTLATIDGVLSVRSLSGTS